MGLVTWFQQSWLGTHTLYWYWIPAIVCLLFHMHEIFEQIRKDLKQRREYENKSQSYYSPGVTLGDVVGYGILSFIPIANIVVTIFQVFPKAMGYAMDFLEWFMNIPLIPRRSK